MQYEDILNQLQALADPEAVAGMAKFAVGGRYTLGISIPTLRKMAKEAGRDHQLAQQLRIPGEACMDAAELLLDAKLVCPLGGEYAWTANPDGSGYWTSTALVDRPTGGLLTTQAPEGFVAPPLSWFRGLDLDVKMTPEALSVHAELIMQMPEEQGAVGSG